MSSFWSAKRMVQSRKTMRWQWIIIKGEKQEMPIRWENSFGWTSLKKCSDDFHYRRDQIMISCIPFVSLPQSQISPQSRLWTWKPDIARWPFIV
jgi:hypothetical protein